jgi:hypothetical protein
MYSYSFLFIILILILILIIILLIHRKTSLADVPRHCHTKTSKTKMLMLEMMRHSNQTTENQLHFDNQCSIMMTGSESDD